MRSLSLLRINLSLDQFLDMKKHLSAGYLGLQLMVEIRLDFVFGGKGRVTRNLQTICDLWPPSQFHSQDDHRFHKSGLQYALKMENGAINISKVVNYENKDM